MGTHLLTAYQVNESALRRLATWALYAAPLASLVLAIAGYLSAQDALDQAEWRAVPAHVVSFESGVYHYSIKGSPRQGTRIKLTYRYSVDGRVYSSSRYSTDEHGQTFNEGSRKAPQRLEHLASKPTLTAYVSPNDPASAVLEREDVPQAVAVTVIGGVAFLVALSLLFWFRVLPKLRPTHTP